MRHKLTLSKLIYRASKLCCSLLLLTTVCWGAVDFNGDGDYIDIGDQAVHNSNNISIMAWFNADVWTGSTRTIVGKFDSDQDDKGYTLFWQALNNSIEFDIGIGSGFIRAFWENFTSIDTWHHIVGTYDGTTLRLYIDGTEKDTTGYSGAITTETESLRIGANSGTANRFFNGKLSEVSIWSEALTAGEVFLLYNSKVKGMPLQIQPANLVGYWPLDDFSDGTVLDTSVDGYKDRSGNGNDGTGVDADGDSTNVAEQVLSYQPN